MNSNDKSDNRSGRKYKVALLLILATVAFFLILEHKAHLVAYSSTIFFIIYILLHLFMHRSHGSHGGVAEQNRKVKGQNEYGRKEGDNKLSLNKNDNQQNSPHEHEERRKL